MIPIPNIFLYTISILFIGCHEQLNQAATVNSVVVGGNFENAEYLYQNMPGEIQSADTSPGWKEQGVKLLVTGQVFQKDAKTPAPGIILYYYQTNKDGRYQHKAGEPRSMPPNSKGQTHGNIRGWVKTDSNGRYSIYTIRPGAYPGFDDPAHIHVTIKEPELNEYYIDDFVFDDDKLLVSAKRRKLENRGGSGILRLVKKDGLLIGERDIILGLNIPDYPVDSNRMEPSDKITDTGLQVGEDVSSFTPFHAWGPDKGTTTCPVCKYGWFHGILYFVGNHPEWNDIRKWLIFLEEESIRRKKYLKVFFIYGNEKNFNKETRKKELEKIGEELNITHVALTYVPSLIDRESEIYLNSINPENKNCFLVYKRSRVIGKFENMEADNKNFHELVSVLDKSINEYFKLNN